MWFFLVWIGRPLYAGANYNPICRLHGVFPYSGIGRPLYAMPLTFAACGGGLAARSGLAISAGSDRSAVANERGPAAVVRFDW